MTTHAGPTARRGPSGAWSRLKAPPTDPLQTYGLPSKGETRLNDLKAQESFYNKIVERYMKFCAASGSDLEKHFAALSLDPDHCAMTSGLNIDDSQIHVNKSTLPNAKEFNSEDPSPELQLILMAMRKLRESIVATRRRDVFAQRCYIFIIRVAILVSSWESYLPAFTYLLHEIHPVTPLDASELNEVVSFQILDFACRLGDFHTAYLIKVAYGIKDMKLQIILHSLTRDDWLSFWRMRKKVDGYRRTIMGYAENDVRLRALKCLGKSYFSAEKRFVETVADRDWDELVASGVGWELQEDNMVIIRRAKAR
ncbi:uncharacterized protein PV09_01144 [Verruconis gallopava]|uniref:CSN8/PSMD8/EIF3K domain-containing protein n=1 Tax=Verruconis gallopava TaxID=253628 RepID=A0A0D1XZG8_9PEZI|nr:uncharacterized protein PV09_01144 [Verruconis gallopava]KIW08216.1 hypothetical protein PV09_01144 [Verruconis gallopava]